MEFGPNTKIDISNTHCCIYNEIPNNNNGGYPYGYPPQIMQNMNIPVQQPVYQQNYPNIQNQYIQQPVQNVIPYQPQQFNPYNIPIQQANNQESYYDPETMQMISNDKPLQQQYNSPLEAFKNRSTYTPGGKTGYVELERADGTRDKSFIQGGTIKVKGGYNPVTGITTEPRTIYPYQQMNNPMTSMYSPFLQVPTGYYNNGYMMPSFNGYGYIAGYPLTEFDTFIQEAIYEENPSVLDGIELLEAVILSDEDRDKINHNRDYGNTIIGRDYYGRPIYNTYVANRITQDQMEQMRRHQINHFVNLSRIVSAYTGEAVDESKIKNIFDPMRSMTPAVQQNMFKKPFNFYTATESEKEDYFKQQQIDKCKILDNVFELREQQMRDLNIQKANAFKRIKESHDVLIGVTPGQHYNLSTYLTNGYKIGINSEMYKLKKAKRNGKLKYNSKAYRNQIIQRGVERGAINTNQIVSSKDDEYLTIESVIKQAYEYNKANIPLPEPKGPQSIMIDFGGNKPKVSPVEDIENNPDIIRDKFFRATYEAAKEKYDRDELRRAAMV